LCGRRITGVSRDVSRDTSRDTPVMRRPHNDRTSPAARRCDDGRHDDVSRDWRLPRPRGVDGIARRTTTCPASGRRQQPGVLGSTGDTGDTGETASSRRVVSDGGRVNNALYSTDV